MIEENLKTAILNNNLIIFVGAGCSIPLNYPSWKTLVAKLLEHFIQENSALATLDFIKLKNQLDDDLLSPLDILTLLESDKTHGNDYKRKSKELVYDLLSQIKSENNFSSENHKLMWKITSKIITTNYDRILERNTAGNSDIKVFDNDNAFMALKSQNNDSQFLYKIHGDFENPTKIVLFESDYKLIYNGGPNNDTLSTFFKSKTFLFIGFSLSDPFINELFVHIKNMYEGFTVGNHFVFSTNKSADYSKYDVKKIYIDNWEDQLSNYLTQLVSIKDSQLILPIEAQTPFENKILEDETDDLFVIIKNKTDELKKDPSNKLLAAEIHDLKSRLNQHLYGDLDYMKSFNKEYKNTHLEMLFETIYGCEKLTNETISEINRIRTDYENHTWYERAQLVSAIACSLFIFNKADEKKISLLVDFIGDNEENVWERTITYLVIILNHLGNKWLRFDSIKRKIHLLTLNNVVQTACQKIVEYMIIFGVDKFTLSVNIFENSFFKDSPYNYFLPFFKDNNPLFENIYDNYTGDDIDRFINFLEKCPLPDSVKYVWCNTKTNNNANVEKINDQNREDYFLYYLNINAGYFPYAGYIQQFVSFINGFPQFSHNKLIDAQIKITSTPLKDHLLNEQERFRVLGIHFMKEKNWGQAIINFEKFLSLVPNDFTVLDNITNCYLNQNDQDKAKDLCKKIISIEPTNVSNVIRLSEIYHSEDNFEEALKVLESCYTETFDLSLLHEKAFTLYELNRNSESLVCLGELEYKNFRELHKIYNIYGLIYCKIKQFEDSLNYYNKSISLNENSINLINRASLYEEMENYDKALEDIERAVKIDSRAEVLTKKIYLLMYLNKFEEAMKILRTVNKKEKTYYNTLANYYRLQGNYEKAFTTIEKAITSNDDKTFLGTKAAIYASNGENEKFYEILEEVLSSGIKAENFLPDIKNIYKNDQQFITILKKYNQTL